jgi:L-lactate dehydrogenase complex protein LldE
MATAVQLFITCLGEQFYPTTLKSMVRILERLGITIEFPESQTCCGQPHFNNGFQEDARKIARGWLESFSKSSLPIVSPSGSCVATIRHHYHQLFPAGTPEHELVLDLQARTFEFTEFLVHQLGVTDVGASFPHKVTYHASCHLLREIGMRDEPKVLLKAVKNLEFIELVEEETCCGFGGSLSVLYPGVSKAMMENKVNNVIESGAEVVTVAEAGCLMNISGGLRRAGSPIRAMHLIDILATEEV